ncbi:MAG TPA: murein tripeptide amidase MpaA [Thermoanaerobaculia bacterium]|nr:murein tripeptide amidase MpaA [Thermoanaerobaculia bacterium]
MSSATEQLVQRHDRGVIRHPNSVYGTSVDGIPLTVYLPHTGNAEIVILAAIHGDESETTVAVSEALRSLPTGELQAAVILCGNPDGMLRGTRGNASGIDLNRNFPTSNWRPDFVFYKSRANDARDIALSPGSAPASEPETRALIALIDRLNPRAVVSLHSALACVDDSGASHLGRQLADRCTLPFLTEIGYPTPGSMGTWAGERGLNLVTLELEDASLYTLKDRHVPILLDLMTGRFELEAR